MHNLKASKEQLHFLEVFPDLAEHLVFSWKR